jgi:hypothetical protein
VPSQPGYLFYRCPAGRQQGHEGVPQLLRRPASAEASIVGDVPELASDVASIERRSDPRAEDEALILPDLARGEPTGVLSIAVCAENAYDRLRQSKGPARPTGLGVAVQSHGAPYRDAGRDRGIRIRLPVQIRMIPDESPGLLGSNSCQ